MSKQFPRKVVSCVIGTISSCGEKMIELKNTIKKYQAKMDGKIDVIPLLPLLGVNHRQHKYCICPKYLFFFIQQVDLLSNFQLVI